MSGPWLNRSQPLRVGVFGAGTPATERISSWARLGVGDVTVLPCDDDGDGDGPTAGALAGRAKVCTELGSFLEQVDMVDVCTRSFLAGSVMTAAASAGRPTLSGWGFLRTLDEAMMIAKVFDDRDVPLLGAGLRFVPPFTAAHKAVADGSIGQPAVLRLGMGSEPAAQRAGRATSIFLESMVSALDYARWAVGEVDIVHAHVTRSGPVFALAVLKHRGGAISHLQALWADRPAAPRAELEISGSEGFIAYRSDSAEPVRWHLSNKEGRSDAVAGSPTGPPLPGVLAVLEGRTRPLGTPRDWAEAFRLALAAQESSTQLAPVQVGQGRS